MLRDISKHLLFFSHWRRKRGRGDRRPIRVAVFIVFTRPSVGHGSSGALPRVRGEAQRHAGLRPQSRRQERWAGNFESSRLVVTPGRLTFKHVRCSMKWGMLFQVKLGMVFQVKWSALIHVKWGGGAGPDDGCGQLRLRIGIITAKTAADPGNNYRIF